MTGKMKIYIGALAALLMVGVVMPAALVPFGDEGFAAMAAKKKKPDADSGNYYCVKNEKPVWLDLEDASVKAFEDDKPLMMFFISRVCHRCVRMEEKVFNREEIACYMNNHLSITKLDVRGYPDQRDKYAVAAIPTILFLTPELVPIDKIVSPVQDPKEWKYVLMYVGEKAYEENKDYQTFKREKQREDNK